VSADIGWFGSGPDLHDPDAGGVTAAARRDRLVAWACGWLTLLQALPYVVVGWISDGGSAAGDGALSALSPASLLGVVGFGVAPAVGLSRPGLQALVEEGAAMGVVDTGHLLLTRPPGVLWSARSGLRRWRWAALASLADVGVLAGAVLLDSGARSGAVAVGDSLDDGSAIWAYLALVLHVLLTDPRAPIAVVVALVALTRARRPVRPRRRARQGLAGSSVARSERRSRGHPPS
jgi:hypothetical protein